jgi:hypothetical protein
VEPVALVEAAEQALGVEGDTALADALRLESRHAPARIARWRAGTTKPDYEGTLALLGAAGMLSEGKRRRPQAAPEEETAALLAQLEADVVEVFARLRDRLGDQARRGSSG